ncbi:MULTISPECIES: NADH-quinone oxidoreductase subunit L [Burkholderia]|uniref:NADH-quinone oxidoreductase subunit L n=1 Tax=Burkholderia TaxID=32008 RepID=UPI0003280DAC|nr:MULTISPECIES: NADH-quinone oxidoreductase subunit L [Burkholderia]AGK46810.1 proton-translocating NADH-quinone oxidoreductase, chain L family protein [Burkholderia thailandensis MSMB121]ATF34367.1 NADH-quinone oxidoreductase subunit L [Burkholderia thailandensis]KST74941.1 NADH:ubiquinone oxidoreductase subunit L [Burkholderia humptydooensis]KVN00795.1 NADH:ubiquinone oxidoreductase subunit L [Burkholderia sp. MSMB1552]KWZ55322.1 NADH:ubiquinone oxidoreductase subunit L [Burkholderia sp. MS
MSTTLNENLLLAIALAPLAGSLIAGLFGNAVGRKGAHRVTILGVAVSFVLSALVFFQVLDGASYNATVYEWMNVGSLKLEVGFLVDTLTAMMMVVVTFVSLMVHIYTIGYMSEEDGYQRFFSYISLFTFSMLMLVMSNNFLQLFFGWEAVGLVSYLLIGFYFTRESAIYANMKAFLVNRVGDFGFLLGIGLILAYAGSMNYGEVFAKRAELASLNFPGTQWGLLTVACICLFIGAMGKSAQFPLHVWLPDSMEGPTPISALIHAATMVTAGIFMVTRMSPLFELSDAALSFITVIGAITALFMGFLGIVQNDIKRVVAYSTLSQLGYMTVALGVSAYPVAVFHLMTHAFFKALLFLGAGSVIIGMHHDQDMRNMGGLRKYMPITWITSLVGSLALIGTPFFSGFYSKDSIIDAVKLSHLPGSGFAYFAVVASVFVTALYSFRMYFLVFHGEERFRHPKEFGNNHGAESAAHHGHDDDHGHGHAHEPHETPWVVWVPLVLLAIPSVIIGAIAIGPMLYGDFFQHGVAFDKVIFIGQNHPALAEMAEEFHGWAALGLHSISSLPLWLALAGVVVAWFLYLKRPGLPAAIRRAFGPIYTLLDNKYYMDKINEVVFAKGSIAIGRGLWKEGDVVVIDGLVNGSARFIGWFAGVIRFLQSGYIYHYAFAMIIGMLGLLTLFVTLGGK